MRPIRGDAFLQAMPVLAEERRVFLRIRFRFFVEPFEHALREHVIELSHQRAVLHRLARDVERQILAVHEPAQKAQPIRKERLRFRLDEDLAAVKVHFRFAAAQRPKLVALARHEEQRANRERRVRREVQPVERRFGVVRDVFVEFLVVALADLAFVLRPERLHGVHLLAVQLDGKGNEIRVVLDDLLDPRSARKLRVAQVKHDPRAPLEVFGLLDFVPARSVARPDPALLGGLRGARVNRHLFRDHERRIKADAKLPDEIRVVLVRLQLLEKGPRAGVRDRPEIFDQFRVRHPDARIGEGDRLRLVIRRDADPQRAIRLEDLRAGSLEKLQFLRSHPPRSRSARGRRSPYRCKGNG